jgi:hypothetical protein
MTSTQVTPAADSSFTPAGRFVLTHFLVIADQDRSRQFCRALFGADVLSERDPVILKVADSWLILNAGAAVGIAFIRDPEPGPATATPVSSGHCSD